MYIGLTTLNWLPFAMTKSKEIGSEDNFGYGDLGTITVEESAWLGAIVAANTWWDATWLPKEPKQPGNASKLVSLLHQRLNKQPGQTISPVPPIQAARFAQHEILSPVGQ